MQHGELLAGPAGTLTLGQQQLCSAAVTLGRSQHQRRAAQLVTGVHIGAVFQQQLYNLGTKGKCGENMK